MNSRITRQSTAAGSAPRVSVRVRGGGVGLVRHGVPGVTLVELLAVMAIMGILLGLLALSIGPLTAQSARRGAVDMILNTFEQARVAALRESAPVYVGFADGSYAVPEERYRAFIVFRDRVESDPVPAGGGTPSNYVTLTKWKKLPKGVSFKSVANPLLGTEAYRLPVSAADPIPNVPAGGSLPVLMFNQTGSIRQPAATALSLLIYEGYFNGSQDVATTNSSSNLFELFTFSRFTGRIRHEVSALP